MKIPALVALSLVVTSAACKSDNTPKEGANPEAEAPKAESAAASAASAAALKPGANAGAPATPPAPPSIPAPEDVAAPPSDAEKTTSGLASKVLKAGTEKNHPAASDTVVVHYTGWTTDGKMFDSSRLRGEPARFPLGRVIAGWTEGLQLMTKGESRRLWIPEALAYKGMPGRPAGMLVFDVELLDIIAPPPAPPDVAKAPKKAKKTKSGLAYLQLQPGKGTEHPKPESIVSVHYTGWTTDGKAFDSSITRGQPARFPLNRVIPGWTEGLQLMVPGEKARFWIPEDLAYKGQPGAPQGTLVFDVELLEIMAPPPGHPMVPPGNPAH